MFLRVTPLSKNAELPKTGEGEATMRYSCFRVLLGVCLLLVVSAPAFSQQARGDQELGLNGSAIIPNTTPDQALALVQVSYGFYFSKHDLLGADTLAFIQKDSQDVFLQARYRHLFSTGNARIYPFLGAAGGINILHNTGGGGPFGSGAAGTNKDGLGSAEAGLKFFVSQRTALEIAYNFQYAHQAGVGFTDSTSSVLTFGFTYLFGHH
jgi:hypothetical protein